MEYVQRIQEYIDSIKAVPLELAAFLHENPETAYHEVLACERIAAILRENGFETQTGLYGVPTCIRAQWGQGHPVIGLLAEYDALPGLSQKDVPYRSPAVPGGPGHGCGHDLLGAATLAAALAIKNDLTENGLPGTVVFYGCPAEEVLTGKPFMARGGAFRELDIALAWHGGGADSAHCGIVGGINSAVFHFTGKAAHASGSPWEGRSALDACELMSVGANYLREHIPEKARIHYVYKEAGEAPNIVPDTASVWYYVRSLSRESIESIYDRLVKVARGAAMMTETELNVEFMGGCYNTHSNSVLVDTYTDVLKTELPPMEWTQDELALARELVLSAGKECPVSPLAAEVCDPVWYEGPGSFDVGDVQHIVPCGIVSTATWPGEVGNHCWQAVVSCGSSIGRKGMLRGAKVLALTAARFLRDGELTEKARREFDEMMGGNSYRCPVPPEVPVPGTIK